MLAFLGRVQVHFSRWCFANADYINVPSYADEKDQEINEERATIVLFSVRYKDMKNRLVWRSFRFLCIVVPCVVFRGSVGRFSPFRGGLFCVLNRFFILPVFLSYPGKKQS